MSRPASQSPLPLRVSGAPNRNLSPNEIAELLPYVPTAASVDIHRLDHWLAMEEQEAVQNDGVKFRGRTYYSDALAPCVSVGQRQYKTAFRVRFDAAEEAAGRLEEIWLDRLDVERNVYVEVAKCREVTLVQMEHVASPAIAEQSLRARARHLEHLTQQRDDAEDARRRMLVGPAVAKKAAMDRRRRASSGPQVKNAAPRPAAPIFADSADEQRAHEEALAKIADRF